MNCKNKAVINFNSEEIEEIKKIVENEDFELAIKTLIRIDKKIKDYTEPH